MPTALQTKFTLPQLRATLVPEAIRNDAGSLQYASRQLVLDLLNEAADGIQTEAVSSTTFRSAYNAIHTPANVHQLYRQAEFFEWAMTEALESDKPFRRIQAIVNTSRRILRDIWIEIDLQHAPITVSPDELKQYVFETKVENDLNTLVAHVVDGSFSKFAKHIVEANDRLVDEARAFPDHLRSPPTQLAHWFGASQETVQSAFKIAASRLGSVHHHIDYVLEANRILAEETDVQSVEDTSLLHSEVYAIDRCLPSEQILSDAVSFSGACAIAIDEKLQTVDVQ